ncbi:MAG: hypothetical protein WAU88_11315 [Candidatus Zixiibacteriota bacterium]
MTTWQLNLDDVTHEFDPELRIVHLSAKRVVHIRTSEQGVLIGEALEAILKAHLEHERGYLVTDISKIVIEPADVELYATKINALAERYLYPHGIARYGYAIGRITVMLSHESNLIRDLNLFASREEAIAFVKGLEVRRMEIAQLQAQP